MMSVTLGSTKNGRGHMKMGLRRATIVSARATVTTAATPAWRVVFRVSSAAAITSQTSEYEPASESIDIAASSTGARSASMLCRMASSSSSNGVSAYRTAVLLARAVFSGIVATQTQAALARRQSGAAKGGQARHRQPGDDHGIGHLRNA